MFGTVGLLYSETIVKTNKHTYRTTEQIMQDSRGYRCKIHIHVRATSFETIVVYRNWGWASFKTKQPSFMSVLKGIMHIIFHDFCQKYCCILYYGLYTTWIQSFRAYQCSILKLWLFLCMLYYTIKLQDTNWELGEGGPRGGKQRFLTVWARSLMLGSYWSS